VPTAFSILVKTRLAERGWSMREFAAKLDPGRPVGSLVGYVSKILSDKVGPPLERLDDWADHLQLSGAERQRFIEAAHLAHAPQRIQELVVELRGEIDRLARRVASLEEGYRAER
jgi:hypothetical protein